MPTSPRPLMIMHPNSAFLERVRRLGGKTFRCSVLPNWSALRRAMCDAPPAALLLVDPYDVRGREGPQLSPELRALLWEFPSATVVAALEVRPGCSHDLRT